MEERVEGGRNTYGEIKRLTHWRNFFFGKKSITWEKIVWPWFIARLLSHFFLRKNHKTLPYGKFKSIPFDYVNI